MLDLFGDEIPQSAYVNVRPVQRELAKLVAGFDWETRDPTEYERRKLSQQIYEAGEMVRAATIEEYGALEDEVLDFGTLPIEEQEAEMRPPPTMLKTMGYTDGYEGRFPREPRNERYMLEHAWGREQKRSEHVDTTVPYIFETRGMLIAADCRVIRGSFNKGV